MFRRRGGDGGGFSGFLAEGTEIDGEVRFADELRIDGKLTGKVLSSKGRLTVGNPGNVEADIEVGTASIGGTVVGTLVASVKVEILATGRVFGNIQSPALIIEEGAVFEGRCEMAKCAAPVKEQDPITERAAIQAAG
jgi:cytoskeletal protein CcmA (bactofilin family)